MANAPSYIANNIQDEGGAQSLTFPLPTHQANDFILVFVKQSENTGQQIWDDDGGGGRGYTREQYNRTTGGRDQESAVYWKFANTSETTPTFTWNSGGTNEQMSGSLLVYRDVDQIVPFTECNYISAQNDANPPNATVRIDYANTMVVVCHMATHDDISTVAAPTGYTLRTQVWNGAADDHRNHFTADNVYSHVSDEYTPPDWQHSVLNETPEYHCYTIALNPIQPIHVTGGTALDDFNWGDTNKTITGVGFESTQGTGKVEFWDDMSGTTKTVQTIDTWSETSIQIDTVQGSLQNNTVIYLVVTNDNGDESVPIAVLVGLVPYNVVVKTTGPDHYWLYSNTYNDDGVTGPVRSMTTGVIGTYIWANNIVDGNPHSLVFDSVTDRREIVDSDNMNINITSAERTLSAWIQLGGIQEELASIWKEGGGIQNLAFLVGYGNVVLAQGADTPGNAINAQAWSDIRLTPNRPYNIVMRYSLTEDPKEFRLYLDGEEQTETDGNPLGAGSFNSHSGDVTWGDPDTNLETGGTDVSYNGNDNLRISDFATWSDNSTGTNSGALDKTTEIRDILFRRGAIPNVTLVSNTEVNMQTDLDQYDSTEIPDWPLGIRVESSSNGSFELIANNVTFNNRISLHLEYRGTATLTWVNQNGSNLSNTSIFTPLGGTVTIIEAVSVKVIVKDINTKANIEGARVLLEADSGGDLTAGEDILTGTTDSNGEFEITNFRYTSDQPITGRVRKGTSSTYYKTSGIAGTITSTGLTLTIFMIPDE